MAVPNDFNFAERLIDGDGRATYYFQQLLAGRRGVLTEQELTLQTLRDTIIGTGFGLSGGGDLSENREIALGDPALSDPGADRGLFWDDSAGRLDWLEFGSGLSLSGTTLSATGGGGGGLTRAAGQSGRYYPPDTIQFNTSTAGGLGNNTLYMHPFSRQLTIDQICFEITAGASAGRNSEFCLYTSHPDTGMPYELIEGSGSVASAGGINAFTLSTPYSVTETVWTGFCVNSSLFTVRIGSVLRFRGHQIYGHTSMSTTTDYSMFTVARTFGDPWPSDLTGTSFTLSGGTVSVAVRAA